jgi:RimJ/RimL family protein N-acetyltransferase
MIQFEKYDVLYLENSWKWLNDPEIRSLTGTTYFTREQQKKWFKGIGENITYKIWGISFNGIPIGVFGVKNIDSIERKGEYWGYIGEKQYWGKGLGEIILTKLMEIASIELRLESLYLRVLIENTVAINLYRKCGFQKVSIEEGNIIMVKTL